ncbi:MAG: sodium:solute symporter family protein, partial [Dehalobacterium sp.]
MNLWLVWLIGFLVGITLLGFYYGRKIKTADDYVMANFSLGFFPVCGSLIATFMGAAAVIGAAGKGYTIGISYGFATAPVFIFSALLALVLGGTIRKLKLYTIPNLFVRRFGKASGLIPSLVISLLYMTPTFGMQIVGMGSILTSIVDISLNNAMLIGFAVCVSFTLMGGLPSVAWTDAIQSVLIVGGVFVVAVAGITHVGGMGNIIANVDPLFFNPVGIGAKEFINYAIVFGPFYLVWQTSWQRLAACRTVGLAKSSMTAGCVIMFIISFAAIFIGIAAKLALPEGTLPDSVYTQFLTILFHPAIGGLFMVSLFAAVLTGATSFLLSGATNVAKDIYQGWISPNAPDKQVLKVARISVAFMALLGLFVALSIKDIISIYMYALSLSAVTMVFPVMAA